MSNFDFLKDFDEKLYRIGLRVEKEVNVSPSGVLGESTRFLQHLLDQLLKKIGLKFNSRKEFYEQLDSVYRKGLIDYKYKNTIYSAYMLRNKLHDDIDVIENDETYIALQLYEKLYTIAKKYYRDFNDNYDSYKGLPPFKPIELDTTNDEIERLKIPDFSQTIDINYDYCIICGEPNHSNYSICCHKCNRVMENANNFISIRNSFGKDARFTKEDLIEFGIHEGYANQLISSLSRENMFKVTGRFITFNNLYMDEYLSRIDNYIAVCELITRFCEDEILPSEIKQTREYRFGSKKQNPFYQFYKIVNQEVINKFERDILTTENIQKSIEFTTITQKQLQRWYQVELNNYQRGNVNESFKVFNDLLKDEYIDLKREGTHDKSIRKQLNVSDEIYEFWCAIYSDFEDEIEVIKLDLLSEAITHGRTKEEAIQYAGITAKEYEDIVKVANFRGTDFAKLRNQEVEIRKANFVYCLKYNDLINSCRFSKFTLNDFYQFYDESKPESEFFKKTTRLLMDKYLSHRKLGKTKMEIIRQTGIKEKYVNRWLTHSEYNDFKDENLKVTVDLILKGFKSRKPMDEIAKTAEVSVNAIYVYIDLGERGSEIYRPIYEYYEENIIPERLSKFLKERRNKSIKKALDASQLTKEELDKYYELGKSGDERFTEFYKEFLKSKRTVYLYYFDKRGSHTIALKESGYTDEEYEEFKDDLESSLGLIRDIIFLEEIADGKTSTVAANKANLSVDEIYEWYFKGKSGDEKYEDFYQAFHAGYVRPSVNSIQKAMDNNESHLDNLLKANKEHFTKKDVEIWVKNGLLDNSILVNLDKNSDEEEKDSNESKFNSNKMLKEMGVKDYDKISIRKSRNTSSILNMGEEDTDKLKREILKK